MQFGQPLGSSGRPGTLFSTLVVMALFLAAFAAVMMAIVKLTLPSQEELSQARVDDIRAVLARCETNRAACLGGFIKYRFNDHILRIDSCGGTCRNRELEVADLNFWLRITDLKEINEVVLPTDAKWPTVAAEYERQFVVRKENGP